MHESVDKAASYFDGCVHSHCGTVPPQPRPPLWTGGQRVRLCDHTALWCMRLAKSSLAHGSVPAARLLSHVLVEAGERCPLNVCKRRQTAAWVCTLTGKVGGSYFFSLFFFSHFLICDGCDRLFQSHPCLPLEQAFLPQRLEQELHCSRPSPLVSGCRVGLTVCLSSESEREG